MNSKPKNKKIIISIIIIVLLLIVGGVFWWKYYKHISIEKTIEEIADYVVEETSEGKIIKSKDGNLSCKVPAGWKLKNNDKYISMPVWIFSPELFTDYKRGEKRNIFNSKEGCLIELGFDEKGVLSLKELEEKIKKAHQSFGLESEGSFEEAEIGNHRALKNILISSLLGHYTGVFVPFEGKVYGFGIYSGEKDAEKCVEEFDRFLENVSIR